MFKRIMLLTMLLFSMGTAVIEAAVPGPIPPCLPCDPSGGGN